DAGLARIVDAVGVNRDIACVGNADGVVRDIPDAVAGDLSTHREVRLWVAPGVRVRGDLNAGLFDTVDYVAAYDNTRAAPYGDAASVAAFNDVAEDRDVFAVASLGFYFGDTIATV